MHSDGLRSGWELTGYPGVARRDPLVIASLLIRDFERGRDDVSVVVARRRGLGAEHRRGDHRASTLGHDEGVVTARQRTRDIAELIGFDRLEQTRVATAVSELARNARRYAGGGEVRDPLRAGPRCRST